MKRALWLVVTVLLGLTLRAQVVPVYDEDGMECTSITVGRKASADGSVMTSHTDDSHRSRTNIYVTPEQDYEPGEKQTLYKRQWAKKQIPGQMLRYDNIPVGEIPQVDHTYQFLNTAYPCVNEKQLAIGESTFGGRSELKSDSGLIDCQRLCQLMLERCATAREAIKTAGDLLKTYGWIDAGECLTIADKNEVWHLEIVGPGKGKLGAVWAAQRVPDDHIAVNANASTIREIDLKNKDYFMASDNVYAVAEDNGWWSKKSGEPFRFAYAYAPDSRMMLACRRREWRVFDLLAPSLKLDPNAENYPFSVKPDENVDVRKVMELFRSTYEGTDMDMTRNVKMVSKKRTDDGVVEDTIVSPVANPWVGSAMMNTINYLAPGTINFQRTVAVAWSSYHHIIQCRSWMPDEIGAICWMACDNPGQSPRIPIFSGSTTLPEGFDKCGQLRYRDEAWIWHYRKANKLATVQWGRTKKTLMDNANRFEQKAFDEIPAIENRAQALIAENKHKEATELLNQYTSDFAASTRQAWKEMENKFWYWFGMGF